MERAPERPRQGAIWWSAAPPLEVAPNDQSNNTPRGISDDQLRDWLSCTAGWKALELSWGALQSCDVSAPQLKPLLQAAMAEACRLGASRLVVRQLDVDEVVGRCVALALSGFPNFTALKLRELNLYDEALAHLAGALHSAEHLRALVLDSVWASEGGWATLAAALKVNCSLRTLRLRYVLAPDSPALTALCAALADPRGSELEALRLGHNSLGDVGAAELCKALARSCSGGSGGPHSLPLSHLDLSYNSVGTACVPAVASMLRCLRSLRHLDLSYNPLGAEGARELCRAVALAPHLASLRLASTGADDTAVEALVRGMAPTTLATAATAALSTVATTVTATATGGGGGGGGGGGLTSLSLAHNRITARGAMMLAAAARRPSGCALADVDLGGNGQIGEQGARAWAEVLSSPGGGSRLRRLVLSGCEVPDEGAYTLGAALKANTCLTELGLAENHISTSGLALLAEVVKVNSSLRVLDVSLNMVGPQGMAPFSRISHLRGHVAFSKAHDHTVQRVSSCLVKAELLREYRLVEAVKQTSLEQGVWLAPDQQQQQQQHRQHPQQHQQHQGAWGASDYLTTDNPFLDGLHPPPPDGGANPFLSPAASYVNPFVAPGPGDPHANPFLVGFHDGAAGGGEIDGRWVADNPFLSPRDRDRGGRQRAHDNPFLSPPDAASVASGAREEGPDRGLQLATRVVTRLGRRSEGAEGPEGPEGCKDGRRGGDEGGSDDGSGTAVYVSSRSTADEGDLVTDLDLKLVDYMIESLGFVEGPGGGGGGSDPWRHEGNGTGTGAAGSPPPASQSPPDGGSPGARQDAGRVETGSRPGGGEWALRAADVDGGGAATGLEPSGAPGRQVVPQSSGSGGGLGGGGSGWGEAAAESSAGRHVVEDGSVHDPPAEEEEQGEDGVVNPFVQGGESAANPFGGDGPQHPFYSTDARRQNEDDNPFL